MLALAMSRLLVRDIDPDHVGVLTTQSRDNAIVQSQLPVSTNR